MKIGDKRLLKLADHLESQHRGLKYFDFGSVCRVDNCGSAGCAIGEMPAVWPKSWEWNDGNTRVAQLALLRFDAPYNLNDVKSYVVMRTGGDVEDADGGWDDEDVLSWFGIDEGIARVLFRPTFGICFASTSVNGVEVYGNHARASAEDVAKTIRQVVAARNPKRKTSKKVKA